MPDFTLIEQLDQAIDLMLSGAAPAPADPALAPLMEIAGVLRDFPHEDFKARLRKELERNPPMTVSSMTATATAAPFAIDAVTPFITAAEGDRLIEFMKRTFDAEETARTAHGSGGGFVATVRIADSDLLIMGGESMRGQEGLHALHVFVKDCDAVYRRALEAGAMTTPPGVGEPADRPYGERSAFVTDPIGNQL